MFRPRKTIPKLAVAMLALTGCGGDTSNGTAGSGGDAGAGGNAGSGGAAGSGGNGTSSQLDAFCMKIDQCYAQYTTQDCIDYYNDEIFPVYNIDPNCPAILSYFECGAQLSCPEIMAPSNSCDDEWDAIGTCIP